MTITELRQILQDLRNLSVENEIVEFKEAKNGYDFRKLGKYFSALCNEANLKGKPHAWLVFGVEDKHHHIVGSQYRTNKKDLDNLKSEIADKTTNRITFIEIHELDLPDGRVIMFQIPAAPKGIPVAFEGHYYGRDGEDLSPLNLEEIERIRGQVILEDWSAAIIPDATLDDLDPEAIKVARANFKSKFPNQAHEVDLWNDITFLNKAKITSKGKITRTAIILLGRDESEYLINPAEAKLRWILLDNKGNQKDYMIVGTPLLLAVDKVFAKIRNLKYRYLKEGTLFPEETYRNRFLAMAMFNLKMVDTAGGGIKKMFNFQRERMFPLPDYDLSGGKVKVTITGKVLDLEYARLLARNQDLTLEEIIMLDKVQKKRTLTSSEERHLKSKRLIEGRKPNYFLSATVAKITGNMGEYIKNRSFDDRYFKDLILEFIRKNDHATKEDIDHLLLDKLPAVLDENQKKNKVRNLIYALSKKEYTIVNQGTNRNPLWKLDGNA
jgi:ATP-dependent DNA helicase RecG